LVRGTGTISIRLAKPGTDVRRRLRSRSAGVEGAEAPADRAVGAMFLSRVACQTRTGIACDEACRRRRDLDLLNPTGSLFSWVTHTSPLRGNMWPKHAGQFARCWQTQTSAPRCTPIRMVLCLTGSRARSQSPRLSPASVRYSVFESRRAPPRKAPLHRLQSISACGLDDGLPSHTRHFRARLRSCATFRRRTI